MTTIESVIDDILNKTIEANELTEKARKLKASLNKTNKLFTKSQRVKDLAKVCLFIRNRHLFQSIDDVNLDNIKYSAYPDLTYTDGLNSKDQILATSNIEISISSDKDEIIDDVHISLGLNIMTVDQSIFDEVISTLATTEYYDFVTASRQDLDELNEQVLELRQDLARQVKDLRRCTEFSMKGKIPKGPKSAIGKSLITELINSLE